MFVDVDCCECWSSCSFDGRGAGGGCGDGVFNIVDFGSVSVCRSLLGVKVGKGGLVLCWNDCDADCVNRIPAMNCYYVYDDGLRRGVSFKIGIIMANNEIV